MFYVLDTARANTARALIVLSVVLAAAGCAHRPEQDSFTGAWASPEGSHSNPASLYIDKTGEIYTCYFLASDGGAVSNSAILSQDALQVGRAYSIKYIAANHELYVVETAARYHKMTQVTDRLAEMRKDIQEVNGANLTRFLYIPFTDNDARLGNLQPDFSIAGRMNYYEATQLLFDKGAKESLARGDVHLTSHNDLEQKGASLDGNPLKPWEYSISFNHMAGRNITLIWSIRNNQYLLIGTQFFS